LEFLDRQGFQIGGEALERAIVDEFISQDARRFLTEIQIPIKNDAN
jgi:effector-binding domain-containing protein